MGKNKDIKLLHEITGLSYKKCRARMKRHSWNFSKALFDGNPLYQGLDEVLKAISDVAEMVADAVNGVADALAKAIKNLDFEKIRVNKS